MDVQRGRAVLPEDSRFRPDAVLPPKLAFTGYDVFLTYPAYDESSHVRVTFEGLDSFRWARGEFSPYDAEDLVAVVEPSAWLAERHAYEADHYGDQYEWGRGADTMLTDTHHYLFLFHDEFVEILARGLWFESSEMPWGPDDPLTRSHPANALGPEARVFIGEQDGIRFEVRANGTGHERLIEAGRLHSQPVFALFVDGFEQPTQSVRARTAHEGHAVRVWVEGSLGVESATFDHVPTLDELMPRFRAHVSQIADRRREMDR